MNHKNINFDVNATEKPDKHVLMTMWRLYHHGYANPNATYKDDRMTAELIETAREKVAKALGCHPDEIFFTSGASESNGLIQANFVLTVDKRSHHSFERMTGINQYDKVKAIPLVVSETGEWLINEVRANPEQEYFLDMTQGIGKMKINLHDMPNVIYASASGHKFGGILGCGILYIRHDKQSKIRPLIVGSQEKGIRGGTQNVPAIVCFGEAIEKATKDIDKNQDKIRKVTNYIYTKIKTGDAIPVDDTPLFIYESIPVNVRMAEPYTNVINITFNHLTATAAVQIFDKLGFNISAGSACNSESEKPSEAYLASGYTEDEAMRTIRISVGKNNTIREAKKFIKALKKIVALYDEGDD